MTSKLTTIIVDDEPLARKGLEVRLADFEQIELVCQCANGREAIEAIVKYMPDIVFLDIQMPGVSGFDVVSQLAAMSIDKLPLVVFVTAFDNYAIKAFEVHALDYLLKPVDETRLKQTIEKIELTLESKQDTEDKSRLVKLISNVTGSDTEQILAELSNLSEDSLKHYSDMLAIKDGSEVTRVPVKEIIWVDAAGDYMCVHTSEETHILRKTMKELEQLLDPRTFIRTHRSIIVNIGYVKKFSSQINGEYFLTLVNEKVLKVSRSYKDKVKQLIVN